MSYFITEQERRESGETCYFEFQKGSYDEASWKEDSLLLLVDTFDELDLSSVFEECLEEFDYYGVTEVNEDQWRDLYEAGSLRDGKIADAFEELKVWVEECFTDNEVFSIVGI